MESWRLAGLSNNKILKAPVSEFAVQDESMDNTVNTVIYISKFISHFHI